VPSQKLKYLEYEDFLILLFAVVSEQYRRGKNEPLPDYSKEDSDDLRKVLEHSKNDTYYPKVIDKAAYIFTSIVCGHIYSNGNKRLALIAMVFFLMINGYHLPSLKGGELKDLAIYVADSKANKNISFEGKKAYVKNFLLTRMRRKYKHAKAIQKVLNVFKGLIGSHKKTT